MATKRDSHSIPLGSGSDDGWYDLLPAGEFAGRDGRGPYLNDRPEAILAAFADWGMPLCIDYHHQSENAKNQTGLVPAAGWGQELRIQDGRIQARIEWTEEAAAAIAAKKVMYLSPVFDYDAKTGRVLRIVMAALTNVPNLELKSLTSHSQGDPMDDIVQRIMYVLNLPATSTPEEVRTHFERVVAYLGGQGGAATTEQAMKTAAHSLGLPESAKWPEIARAAASRLESGASVPKAEYERVSHALAKLEGELKETRVDTVVRAAMSQGKIAPAMEEWARTYASSDLAGFEAYVAAAPAIVDSGEVVPSGSPKATVSHASLPVPAGFGVRAETADLHKRAKDFQAEHGGTFVEAVKAVQQTP